MNCKLCVVAKANAYGIGLQGVVQNLKDLCEYFAVATEKEAKSVQKLCKNQVILLTFPVDLQYCVQNEICFLVSTFEQLEWLFSQKFAQKPRFFIKLNCGMNRLGFDRKTRFCQRILQNIMSENYHFFGVLTHFHTNSKGILAKENKCLQEFCQQFQSKIQICSKATCTIDKKISCDIARVGFELYKDCFVLKSKILQINSLKIGDYLGYGNKKVKKNMSVAIVCCGYGDGLFRNISQKYCVKIHSKPCKIVGSVCMDYFFCDITNVDAKVGDEVVIIENFADLKKMSKVAKTIEYEIICAFSQRIERIYVD